MYRRIFVTNLHDARDVWVVTLSETARTRDSRASSLLQFLGFAFRLRVKREEDDEAGQEVGKIEGVREKKCHPQPPRTKDNDKPYRDDEEEYAETGSALF